MTRDDQPIPITFTFLEAMGTLAALRAVIDSAPATPTILVAAERKLVAATDQSDPPSTLTSPPAKEANAKDNKERRDA